MSGALEVLLTGVTLGVSIAAPPGPVTALSAQQVVSRSWLSGWLVTLGATTADGVFFVLTYFGVARLVTGEERAGLFVVGGVLMLYLAALTVHGTMGEPGSGPEAQKTSKAPRSPFLMGLTMGLTNPYQLGWWIAVGAAMVADFGLSIAAGFFIGIVAWTIVMTAAVHASVARYQGAAPLVAYASALLMVAFGAWFLWQGLSTLL